MHPAAFAVSAPDRPAVIMGGSGEVVVYGEMIARANRLGRLLRGLGLPRGGVVAVLMENHPRYLEILWAAQSCGLRYTTVNSHLTVEEAAYIVDDCDATVLISSLACADVAGQFDARRAPKLRARLMVDGTLPGWQSYESALAGQSDAPVADACEGAFMLYSSGTTGRPKGIARPMGFEPLGEGTPGVETFLRMLGLAEGDVYLCPAPLYHAAPLGWSMAAHRLGATVVVMERFDAAHALELIELHRVTHAQFVPTMFVRMTKLPEQVRSRFDLSSLRAVVHAAAPCPVEVKRAMIEWWGPIVHEYYSSTEAVGFTFITAQEWLRRPGSVGKALVGQPHILDDAGKELPPGEVGTVWFSEIADFAYHKDPEKSAQVRRPDGAATVGDIGYLDDEGYLYLTDRKNYVIISGGVNLYPREIEDVLVTHPKVTDVAVLGVPDSDLGEAVKAVVEPVNWNEAGPELEAELIAYCRQHLSHHKCPRSVDFERRLPRLDNGKLYKRALLERYRTAPSPS
jgi:long-chain acyl-CoA synthetase